MPYTVESLFGEPTHTVSSLFGPSGGQPDRGGPLGAHPEAVIKPRQSYGFEASREALERFGAGEALSAVKSLGKGMLQAGAAVLNPASLALPYAQRYLQEKGKLPRPSPEQELQEQLEAERAERGSRVLMAPLEPLRAVAEEAAGRAGFGPTGQAVSSLVANLAAGAAPAISARMAARGPSMARTARTLTGVAEELPGAFKRAEPPISAQAATEAPTSVIDPNIAPIAGGGLPFKQVEPGARAENIFLDRLFKGTEPELSLPAKQELLTQSRVYGLEFHKATRGVRHLDETLEFARAIGADPKEFSKLIGRGIGRAANAEEIEAVRMAAQKGALEAVQLAKLAARDWDTYGSALLEATARSRMVTERLSGYTAEAGRALRQLREESTPLQKSISLLWDKMSRDPVKGSEFARQMAAIGEDPNAVLKFAGSIRKPDFWDKLLEFRANNMLFSVASNIRNLAGNITTNILVRGEAYVESFFGAIFRSESRIGFRALSRGTAASLQGLKEGLKNGLTALRNEGVSPFEELIGGGFTKQQEIGRRAIGGVTGTAVRLPSRTLSAEDEVFKSLAYTQRLTELAYEGARGNRKAMERLMRDPPGRMVELAAKYAHQVTFTDPDVWLTKLVTNIYQHKSRPVSVASRLLMPFGRTGSNIAVFTARRMPLLGDIVTAAQVAGAKGRRGAEAAAGLSKTAIPWLSAGLLGWLLMEDGTEDFAITADTALMESPARRKEQMSRAGGFQHSSLKIGEKMFRYQRIDPAGAILASVANLSQMLKAGVSAEAFGEQFIRAARTLKDQIPMFEAPNWIDAIVNRDTKRPLITLASRFAGSFIPGASMLRSVSRAADPFERETSESMAAGLKAQVGLRKGLPPQEDIFGRPVPGPGLPSLLAVESRPVTEELPSLIKGEETRIQKQRLSTLQFGKLSAEMQAKALESARAYLEGLPKPGAKEKRLFASERQLKVESPEMAPLYATREAREMWEEYIHRLYQVAFLRGDKDGQREAIQLARRLRIGFEPKSWAKSAEEDLRQ